MPKNFAINPIATGPNIKTPYTAIEIIEMPTAVSTPSIFPAKLYDIGAGTNEIRRMLIGRELFCENIV